MNSVKEWDEQFKGGYSLKNIKQNIFRALSILISFICLEKYDYVGKLLKPGEAPTNYSDEEDEGSQQETESKTEQQESETKSEQGIDTKSKND